MKSFFYTLLLCLSFVSGTTLAAEPAQPATPADPAAPADPATPSVEEPVERDSEVQIHLGRGHSDNVVINMWGDAQLGANEVADGVISIFGDAHVEGEVIEAVVTMFGNARVTGPVHGGVVSLFGNTYIDGPVQEAAVAVFGDLELGPNARVDGDIAVVAGKLTRDPGSVVRGQSEIVAGGFPALEGVRLWIEKCLLYGRPLAFERELWWAWAIAVGFLLFYVVIALLFDRSAVR
ncbi:MAG: bactofilin family protein, partial [Steroidobacteraceae bacterium]